MIQESPGRIKDFTAVLNEYVILYLDINDYKPTKTGLPEGLNIEYGEPSDEGFKNQYQRLLKNDFICWKNPYYGKLKGYRKDSLIRVMKDKELIAGGLLCAGNQFDDETEQGEFHYVFVASEFRGRGVYSYLFNVAVERAKEWGLKGLYFDTDRKGLPDIKRRWGFKDLQVIKKKPRPKQSYFHRLASQTKSALRKLLKI
jgi:GNAT superfamily N-acetyltransferase